MIKTILTISGSIILAGALAYGTLHYIMKEEDKWIEESKNLKKERIISIEKSLKSYEKIHRKNPDSFFILNDVINFDTSILDEHQKIRYNTLLGDLYLSKYKNSRLLTKKEKEYYFSISEKYFKKAQTAAIKLNDKNVIKNIKSKLGAIYLESKNWKKALETYKADDSLSLLYTDDLWIANLHQAKCLNKLGKYYEALQILEKVIGKSDNDNLWSQALRQKADLFFDIATDDKKLKQFIKTTKTTIPIETFKENLLNNAFDHYNSIIKEAPITSKEVVLAQKGKLEIFIYRNDGKNIYKTLNKINYSSTNEVVKVEALMLAGKYRQNKALALLEKNKNDKEINLKKSSTEQIQIKDQLKKDVNFNYTEAIKLYDAAAAKFKNHEYYSDIVTELYLLNKKIGKLDAAFDNIKLLFTRYPNEKNITKTIPDFMPENNENLIKHLAEILDPQSRNKYYEIIRAMLKGLKKEDINLWNKFYKDLALIQAQLYFHDEDYENAEKKFLDCFNIRKYSKEEEDDIYYHYYKCGAESNVSPAINIFRIKMYLAKFPKGKRTKQMLNHLLKLYTDNDMFYSAMKIANKMYLAELKKIKKGANKSNTDFLRITASLGKAFKEIQDFEKAEIVLNTIKDEVLDTSDKNDVYLDWADLAVKRNQEREAIRRLNVLISTISDEKNKIKPLVARSLLELKRGDVKYFLNAKKLLKYVESSKELKAEEKRKLLRSLNEGLLEYAYAKGIWAIHPLTDKLGENFAGEPWINYWYIRALTPLFGSSKLEAVGKKYEDTLKSKLTSTKGDEASFKSIQDQLNLINSLVVIEKDYKNLKKIRRLK